MMKKVPQYLSAPLQILWFDADAVYMFVLLMFFAMICTNVITLGAMIVIPIAYVKMTKNYPRGFIKHSYYYIGITTLKGYPTSYEDKFYE